MLTRSPLADLQLSQRARVLYRWSATDLFAGAGGSSQGLHEAGIAIRLCANHNPLAISTHALNHPGADHRTQDLSNTDFRSYPRTSILWASPSCVHHARARAGKKLTAEAELRRDTVAAVDRATAFAIIEAAEIHRYPIIYIENVLDFRNWVLYEAWVGMLQALGYEYTELTLDAADFALGQNRKRHFGAATLPGIDLDLTPPTAAPVYAADIIDDDPGRLLDRRLYVSDQIDTITERGVRYLVTYRRNAKAVRADQSRLATITAGGHHHAIAELDSRGRTWYRMLTNRECARAQGFPDEYQFNGNYDTIKHQIGNAVPVTIARWLGTCAIDALDAAADRGMLIPA